MASPRLTSDTLITVLAHLQPYDIVTGSAAVCKEWSTATKERALWSEVMLAAIKGAQIKLPFLRPKRVVEKLEEVAGRRSMEAKVGEQLPNFVFDQRLACLLLLIFILFFLPRRISSRKSSACQRCWRTPPARTRTKARNYSLRDPTPISGPVTTTCCARRALLTASRTAWRIAA